MKESKITIIGTKFSAYILGLFMKYNLKNFKLNKKVEIFPIEENKKDAFFNGHLKEHIIKPGMYNNQVKFFHKLIGVQGEDVTVQNKGSLASSFNITKNKEKVISESVASSLNAFRMKKFEYQLWYFSKKKLLRAQNEDISVEEFLSSFWISNKLRRQLEDYFYCNLELKY